MGVGLDARENPAPLLNEIENEEGSLNALIIL